MLCFQVGPEGQGPLPTSAWQLLWAGRGIFSCPLDTQVASAADRSLGQASLLLTPPPPLGWQYGNRIGGQVADLHGPQGDPLFPSRLRTVQPRKWALEWSFMGERLQVLAIPEQASMDGVGGHWGVSFLPLERRGSPRQRWGGPLAPGLCDLLQVTQPL